MSLTHYLAQLQTLVAFSIKQKHSKTVDETVVATLEMESYLFPTTSMTNRERWVSQVDMGEAVTQVHVHVADDNLAVATTGNVSYQAELFHKMTKLQERVEY